MNLIDSKDLSVALLDLFQLPQKIPKIQIHQPNTNQSNITNKIIKKKKTKSINQEHNRKQQNQIIDLTRTWTWREPRWWPRASCGKSWDAHRIPMGEPSRQPGTGETASQNKKN